jgi:hypothetical protein
MPLKNIVFSLGGRKINKSRNAGSPASVGLATDADETAEKFNYWRC